MSLQGHVHLHTFGVALFGLAFFVGVTTQVAVDHVPVFEAPQISPIAGESQQSAYLSSDTLPEYEGGRDYEKTLGVKLLTPGDHHANEIHQPLGGKWIGLFRVDGSYVLRETRLKRSDDCDEGYDTCIKSSPEGDGVFFLRGSTGLTAGTVETVFDARDDENSGYLTGAPVTFGFRGQFWRLRTENLDLSDTSIGTSLFVESSAMGTQLIRDLKDGCDDCSWSVEWVGDLNRDGNLDFFLDLSGHYNSSEPALFLSTSDGRGQILRLYAASRYLGC